MKAFALSCMFLIVSLAALHCRSIAAFEDRNLSLLCKHLSAPAENDTCQRLILTGLHVGDNAQFYFPGSWRDPFEPVSAHGPLDLMLVLHNWKSQSWLFANDNPQSRDKFWRPLAWNGDTILNINDEYLLFRIPGKTVEITDSLSWQPTGKCLIIYRPDKDSLSVSSQGVHDIFNSTDLRYRGYRERFQVKLEIFSRLAVVYVVCENREEFTLACATVEKALVNFGGKAALFVPTENIGEPIR